MSKRLKSGSRVRNKMLKLVNRTGPTHGKTTKIKLLSLGTISWKKLKISASKIPCLI